MPFELKLPDIGEGVAEGEIVRWLVKVGDRVREDQPLVEVMTDKASVEIPSPRTGVIAALLAEEGQVVNVGATIVAIDVDGEAASAPAAAGHGAAAAATSGGGVTATAAPPSAPAGGAGSRVQAAPAVRQLAKQLGVALETLTGSGPGGAITAQDVQRAAGAGTKAAGTTAPAAGSPAAPPAPSSASTPPGAEERIPVRGLRRRIAEHMRHSIDTAAHFTFVAECDWTEIVKHRAALRTKTTQQGIPLTYLAYVVRALVPTLRDHPMLNASLDDERGEIVIKKYLHVGIATHTPEGLTVPVIRDADAKSLLDLAREIDRLAQGARTKHLELADLQGATFTVTSTGNRGGVLATPILHHPQVAILGVHEIKKRPAVVADQIVIRELGNLSLSLDHRVVDGAVGADFLYDLIRRLEHPAEWLGDPEGA